jgi:hypothetical protein
MLGVFLLPLAPQIQTEDKKLGINLELRKIKAQQEQWWFAHSVPGNPNESLNVGPFNSITECQAGEAQVLATFNNIPGSPNITITESCHLVSTPPAGNTAELGSNPNPGIEFGCDPLFDPISIVQGCIVALVYGVLFEPLSWITKGAAKILDYFVYYSTSDETYRNIFVEKGWGAVRDIANIMFIIGLLFVAIKTILGLNTTNNKKMIGNIIIFALIINFSLFATQVIVDASNILAKVFYHQITPVNSDGVRITGDVEQRSVTVGIVDKFEPQQLLSAGTNSAGDIDLSNIKAQTLLVLILLIILMAFMIYIFISVSFLFVARTVSIWLAMILAPVAFASNAISPNIKGLGWNEWLSNLLKSAFMAPIFIFFLYIIILFGDLFAVGGVSATGGEDTNIAAFMATFIPFMLIFVLLSQAKKLAVSYSGEMGSAISKGALAVGGLALGGAALTTAFAGRTIAGRGMAAMSRRTGATDYADKKMEFGNEVKNGTFSGNWSDYKKAKGLKYGLVDRLGGRVNYSQKKTQDVDHAREELDEAQKKAHLEGVDRGHLSGTNIKKIKETFIDSKKSEIEDKLRKGDEKTLKLVSSTSLSKAIEGGQEAYKARNRGYLVNDAMSDDKNLKRDKKGNLTSELKDDVKKKIEDTLTINFNAMLKDATKQAGEKKYTDTTTKAEKGVNIGTRGMAKTTSGSYDIRDAAKMVADKRAGLGIKGTAMLIAAVAGAIRLGVKKGAGMEPGKSNGDFTKDISGLIKESLNVKIDLGGGGGDGGGHAKPSGGGGHGGGGGHH